VLLSDTKTQQFLAERTVTAWESVGPVPTVTVDFGNGKTLKRTLGGNTVLQLLLPDGRVLDAFPGVYTPDDFRRELDPLFAMIDAAGGLSALARTRDTLRQYHILRTTAAPQRRAITQSKAAVEGPILPRAARSPGAVLASSRPTPPTSPATGPVEDLYRNAFVQSAARLVDVSKIPTTAATARSSYASEGATPEERGIEAVRRDSTNNIQVVRPVVHMYFAAQGNMLPTMAECRETMYEKVLHTPLKDPYLGLADVLLPGTDGGKD
jgi:hypothetical protein